MLSLERKNAILACLKEKNAVTVSELSRRFFISESSIRRDLAQMERSGLIRKTYGGAVLVQGENEVLSLEARRRTEWEAKQRIARQAAALVENGDVLFLDSSSTSMAMIPYLGEFANLSVITTGIKIAAGLAEYPQLRVYSAGGLITPRLFSCSGSLTLDMLAGIHADTLFVSPNAVDREGNVFCADEEEAAVRRRMLRQSDEAVLLCSRDKLGRSAAFRLCSMGELSRIVCDGDVGPEWNACFREHHTELCVAESER